MTDIDRYNYAFDPDGDAWAARLLRRLPPEGAVLELGPGPGAMTKVMVDRGYSVTVVENDPGAIPSLNALGVEVINGNLEGDDWIDKLQGRRFDAVLACDVLEHLRSPEHVLKALAPIMQPAGALIISIPNVSYGGVVAGLINGAFDYTDTGLLDRTHLRFFTRRSMEQSLLELGWSPRMWEPYRHPIEGSEFAWCWNALSEAQRQSLATGCVDFDVYEWMVVATPAVDSSAWAVKEARAASEKMRDELQALTLVHAGEHASLLEHQKAFSEAKSIIEKMQKDLQATQDELNILRNEKLTAQPEAAPPSSWLRRLLGPKA
ncbi:MAG: class I SAM-dependent methyltransferase [Acidovorax sp.]|nr:MAG: class I SAM-dependent methyltransferase [Acidovorax sp.]